jgi:hypothetical protein
MRSGSSRGKADDGFDAAQFGAIVPDDRLSPTPLAAKEPA